MSQTVQHAIVICFIVAAIAYLARHAWQAAMTKKGCGCASGSCARMNEVEKKLRAAGKTGR